MTHPCEPEFKLEVGKKYNHPEYNSCNQYVYVGPVPSGLPVFVSNYGNLVLGRRGGWEEVKEPRKGVRWVNVWDCEHNANIGMSVPLPTRQEADRQAPTRRIACIEVPWIEGQGL